MNVYFVIVFAMISIYVVMVYIMRQRVITYVNKTYQNITGLSVCWTLFGPISPGSGNIKFYVRISISNDEYITLYVITSILGNIYINERKDD